MLTAEGALHWESRTGFLSSNCPSSWKTLFPHLLLLLPNLPMPLRRLLHPQQPRRYPRPRRIPTYK